MLTVLILVAIFLICAAIFSVLIRKKQEKHELDKGMNATTAKHPFLANPILLAYLLLPVTAVILILYYYNS